MHDGAAVLLRDGQLICALEEERLIRVKHSNFFPAYLIANCLKIAGLSLAEVDVIAMNFEERTRSNICLGYRTAFGEPFS